MFAEDIIFEADRSLDALPPANIEVEESILGGILLDPDAIGRVVDLLVPEAFYHSAHRDIYCAALDLFAEGKTTDLLTVTSKLMDIDRLTKIGGRNKLATLLDRAISAVNIDSLAELVMEKYERRRMISTGNKIVQLGYKTEIDYPECLETAEKHISLLQEANNRKNGPVGIGEVLIDSFNRLERLSDGELEVIPTGLYDLDDAFCGGLRKGELVTWMGSPAMGKSVMAAVLLNAIAAQGYGALLFNLEMDSIQTSDRLLSAEAGIEHSKLRNPSKHGFSQQEWDVIGDAIGALSKRPLFLDDDPSITMSGLRARAKAVKKQCEAQGKQLGVIAVDYVQLLAKGGSSTGDKAVAVDNTVRDLKLLARELEVSVLMLSQISRDVKSRKNKRPALTDAADSSGIEKHSDIVIGLYRDEYYNPDTPDRGILEAIILKQRNGPCCTVKTLFDGQYQRIKNLAKNY